MENNLQKYNEMIKTQEFFITRLENRLDKWVDIHKEMIGVHNYGKFETYKYDAFKDYNRGEEFFYKFLETEIECKYKVYYSGCGTETKYLNIDIELVIIEDDDLENYFLKKKEEVKKHNENILIKQKTLIEDKKKKTEEESKLKREKQYELLKKEFEKEGK